MQVADLAKGAVVALETDDRLFDAAREMEDNGVSAVVVLEDERLVGIITERDLVRAAADGVSFEDTPLEDYMTASPLTLRATADVQDGLRTMLEGEFRHVPVTNTEGEVVGILKLRDVAQALAEGTASPRR